MSNRTRTPSSSASTPSRRPAPILSLVITAAGTIEIEPGEGFMDTDAERRAREAGTPFLPTDEHCDLLTRAHEGVATALAAHPVTG